MASSEQLMEIYKSKLDDLKSLLSHYINAFAIATGINGALLKFALEKDTPDKLRNVFILFGIVLTFLGILACVFAEAVRRSIGREIQPIAAALSLPESVSSMLVLRFASIIVGIFVTSCFIGWIYLWFH